MALFLSAADEWPHYQLLLKGYPNPIRHPSIEQRKGFPPYQTLSVGFFCFSELTRDEILLRSRHEHMSLRCRKDAIDCEATGIGKNESLERWDSVTNATTVQSGSPGSLHSLLSYGQ
jgi:hypothetical protein